MSGYLQGNALGLLMPKDQTQASTLNGLGLSTLYGSNALMEGSGGALEQTMDAYQQRMSSMDIPQIGEGQAPGGINQGIHMQQASEDNPFGQGEQQYDPGVMYTSLYQTGNIIG